jgi:hypothetical protein
MVERGCGTGLLDKSSPPHEIGRGFEREKLQGHEAVKLFILGLVHNSHSSFTKFIEDSVMGDCLTDHCIIPQP